MGTVPETIETIPMPYRLLSLAAFAPPVVAPRRVRAPDQSAPRRSVLLLALLASGATFACAGDVDQELVWGGQEGDASVGTGNTTSAPTTDWTRTDPNGHFRPDIEDPSGPNTQPSSSVSSPSDETPTAEPTAPGTVVTTGGVTGSEPSTSSSPSTAVAPEPPSTQTDDGSMPTPSEPVAPGAPSDETDSPQPEADAGEAPGSDAEVPDDMMAPIESAFDIEIEFLDGQQGMGLSPAVRQAFTDAQAVWEQVIVGDLPDVELSRREACFADKGAYAEGTIDDLRIFVLVTEIDGPNGVLGAAAPCLARRDIGLPFAGYMEFDSADLDRFADDGRLAEVVIHEMGHVLGIGSLWARFGLLVDQSFANDPRDTHFTGSRAVAAFDELGGEDYSGAKVPVENVGGEGTANGHWREELLGNELMTSYMTRLEGVLSTITIGSLEDLGYEVSYATAGAFAWPPPDERGGFSFLRSGSETMAEDPEAIHFGDDILDIPVRYFD